MSIHSTDFVIFRSKLDAACKDGTSKTPFWQAAWNGHEAVVKLLLSSGKVDVDYKYRIVSQDKAKSRCCSWSTHKTS